MSLVDTKLKAECCTHHIFVEPKNKTFTDLNVDN